MTAPPAIVDGNLVAGEVTVLDTLLPESQEPTANLPESQEPTANHSSERISPSQPEEMPPRVPPSAVVCGDWLVEDDRGEGRGDHGRDMVEDESELRRLKRNEYKRNYNRQWMRKKRMAIKRAPSASAVLPPRFISGDEDKVDVMGCASI